MSLLNGILFLLIVGGTLALLILAGRRERRAEEQLRQELLDVPHDPIDRAVTRKDDPDPLAQTRRPVGQTFPVRAKRVHPNESSDAPATQVESINDGRDAPG